jgi:hypothetical protein
VTYDPDNWLTSAQQALEDYITNKFNNAVVAPGDIPGGLDVWKVVMDFPESDDLPDLLADGKTIVHFALDDIDNRRLGMGSNVVDFTEVPGVGGAAGHVDEVVAGLHYLNFDVGIWAYDRSGGASLRIETYQYLEEFLGVSAQEKVMEATDGIEIQSFNGGRWVTDRVGGVRVFRTVDAELVLRVYSRKSPLPPAPLAEEIVQVPGLTIDELDFT